MKAEVKIVAFMFFSVVMQFVYLLEKKHNLGVGEGVGEGWRGTRAEGQEGQILVAYKNKRWGPGIIK